MAEVYIRADSSTGVVTFIHRRPFDPVNGLGETRDNLSKTGFFVDEFPEPKPSIGKRAVAYYDHERKKVYYEYELVPFSEKEQLSMMQNMMNEMILSNNSSNAIMPMAISTMAATDDREVHSEAIAKYLAYQIYQKNISKEQVFSIYPQEQDTIQKYLAEWETIPVEND